ncbi:MAG: hypothetical protein ACK5KQ_03270 [Anaerorhabdus sp.]
MKKVIKWIVIILVILAVIIGLFSVVQKSLPKSVDEDAAMDMLFGKAEVESGLSYTGKVMPKDIYYYSLDVVEVLNNTYVKQGDYIEEGKLLFDYKSNLNPELEIEVLEKEFMDYEQIFNDYYTRLDNLKKDLEGADKENEIYINYLNVEINGVEKMIAQTRLQKSNTEQKIKSLKEGSSSKVFSDVSGLIYQLNDPEKTITPLSYIVLYSDEKAIKLSISEFEYQNFQVGQKVEVYVEALDKTYESIVESVGTVPNNLETVGADDTSYYDVYVNIDESVPYGFSVIVKVASDE